LRFSLIRFFILGYRWFNSTVDHHPFVYPDPVLDWGVDSSLLSDPRKKSFQEKKRPAA